MSASSPNTTNLASYNRATVRFRPFQLALALCVALAACGASSATPASNQPSPLVLPAPAAPQATLTPRAFLPSVKHSEFKRILFINGDHIPENGYPHSRVRDDGTKPESFTRLRNEVLEREVAQTVDEFVLTASNAITPGLLSPYTLIVLGSNGRALATGEVTALTNYFNTGGSVLLYADFQFGPNNWASDNSFLKPFGVEVFPDNFQPTTQITDMAQSHPIMQGVTSFATEGSSQFLISAATQNDNIVLSKCSPLERSGCAVQQPELDKIKPGDVVACTWVRENANAGRSPVRATATLFTTAPALARTLTSSITVFMPATCFDG